MPRKPPQQMCDREMVATFDYSELSRDFAKLAKPGQRALLNDGICTPEDLSKRTLEEVTALHAIGASAIPVLRGALGSTTSDSSGEQNPVTIRRVVNRMESRRIVSQDAVELTNEELVVHDKNGRWEPQGNSDRKESPVEFDSVCERQPQATEEETVRIRAARAKSIEETTYHLTDLFTIISARLEMLSEKVPEGFRPELLGIRGVLARGVELNHRLYLTAQACRREIGRPLTTTEIIEEQEA